MKTFTTGVLVIGGGAAGLAAAVTARRLGKQVLAVSKYGPGAATCTTVSNAGFSKPGGTFTKEKYRKATLQSGLGLNESELVNYLTEHAEEDLGELVMMGVPLEERPDGCFCKAKSPFSRGASIVLPLRAYAKKIGVDFIHPYLIWELVVRENRVLGAWGYHQKTEEPALFLAQSVILAAGGAAAIYHNNDNPSSITGDGYAMAARTGLELIDMEFVQFYPLCAVINDSNHKVVVLPPVSAEVAALKNNEEENLIHKYGISRPAAIKSRDLTSRAIIMEKNAHLDFSSVTEEDWQKGAAVFDKEGTWQLKEWLEKRCFPRTRKIPLTPAAHFCIGGIKSDFQGKTALQGLFAAGEVTGGLHGANRLGGNALSEAFVFGKQAGLTAAYSGGCSFPALMQDNLVKEINKKAGLLLEETSNPAAADPAAVRRQLALLMCEKVGVIRNGPDLTRALEEIIKLKELPLSRLQAGIARALEVKNMLLVGEMICRAALFRQESRGCHYRLDFPERDDTCWKYHSCITKKDSSFEMQKLAVR
ncbi:MAG: FAD-binding protein [Peptococcaceae bacterium]|jgi:succinate dehydrogenase/fumarate reductase flavoprotein subunit|nr:FAD-binding protein [Peptococcaceae bacterium]MDH7524485.1 FAD-binding protein [Peptococcaceae bacterium]